MTQFPGVSIIVLSLKQSYMFIFEAIIQSENYNTIIIFEAIFEAILYVVMPKVRNFSLIALYVLVSQWQRRL